ncbi:MAG: MFS transporter [Ruminococcaceae bacterium]|nr:MFS transporter [Oscillospiraceae bacterium]
MNIRNNFRHTVYASYISYITQAAVNNFLPLLFVMFNTQYNISLSQIGLLVALNFCTQICVDLFAAKFAPKIGYRKLIITSGSLIFVGFVLMGILPDLLPSAYLGLCISMFICAVGGGLSEAIVSPIIEFCPLDNKSGEMSLLHSFYCWGCVLVIGVSTAFFAIFGMGCWKYVALGWSIIPLFDAFYFSVVPMPDIETELNSMPISKLLKNKLFWVFALLMMGAGASELIMAQWASAFAESGLGVSKAIGDIAGPCAFAVLMGISRVFHAKIGDRISLPGYIMICSVACVFSYILASLSPIPALALVGCGICGFSVGVMWPGIYSYSAKMIPRGGTAMFALLAFAGDTGCSFGPFITGVVSKAYNNDLAAGLLCAALFPVVIIIGLMIFKKMKKAD